MDGGLGLPGRASCTGGETAGRVGLEARPVSQCRLSVA